MFGNSYIEFGVAIFSMVAILYFTSDSFKQLKHDGFVRNLTKNKKATRRSVHRYLFWRETNSKKDWIAASLTVLGFVVTVISSAVAAVSGDLFTLSSPATLFALAGLLISVITLLLLFVDYFSTVRRYERSLSNADIRFRNGFNGRVKLPCEGGVPRILSDNDRHIDVSHGSAFAHWDEAASSVLASNRVIRFKTRPAPFTFQRVRNTKRIVNQFRRWRNSGSLASKNLYFRYRSATCQLDDDPNCTIKTFNNDPKIRIDGFKNHDEFVVSKTDYYTSQITNVLCSQEEYNPAVIYNPATPLDYCIPAVADGEGRYKIDEFHNISHQSNHVGGVHLSLSSDGFPLIGLQNRFAAVGAGTVVFCGAGSADWSDIAMAKEFSDGSNFMQVLRHAQARELLEETGVVMQDSVALQDQVRIADFAQSRIKILGMYRNVSWGGLPIFFGVSKHTISYQQYVHNMRKNNPLYKRLELDTIDYINLLRKKGYDINSVNNCEHFLKFVHTVLPVYQQLSNNIVIEPDTGRQLQLNYNSQMFIIRNILQRSKAARQAFDGFISSFH